MNPPWNYKISVLNHKLHEKKAHLQVRKIGLVSNELGSYCNLACEMSPTP